MQPDWLTPYLPHKVGRVAGSSLGVSSVTFHEKCLTACVSGFPSTLGEQLYPNNQRIKASFLLSSGVTVITLTLSWIAILAFKQSIPWSMLRIKSNRGWYVQWAWICLPRSTVSPIGLMSMQWVKMAGGMKVLTRRRIRAPPPSWPRSLVLFTWTANNRPAMVR